MCRSTREQPIKILVVDDAATVVEQLTANLRGGGYDVVTAHDGLEAKLRLCEHPDIQLAIVDLHMPRMDGQELVEHIRNINGLEDRPIVVLTTDKAPANLDKAMSKGATGWILKPHDPERLLQAIERILDAASPAEP